MNCKIFPELSVKRPISDITLMWEFIGGADTEMLAGERSPTWHAPLMHMSKDSV